MLEHFFAPKSVAVIGASRDKNKVGYSILDNLIRFGYKGKIFPINPFAKKINGIRTYSNVTKIPSSIDLCIVAIPSNSVPGTIKECGVKGIDSIIVISAGFKESGVEGAKLEKELATIGKKIKARILGPNCLGIVNTSQNLNASFAKCMPKAGNIGFFSQSGALGTAILDWAVDRDIGFSKFITLGNKMDIDEVDILKALGDDLATDVIVGYIEGVTNGQLFMNIAKAVSSKKPVIIMKSGSTQAGAKAASSHTGTLAGRDEAVKAAFYQSGIIRAYTTEELFDFALAFAYQHTLRGDSIALITNAGGPGIIAADAVERSRVKMATISKTTVQTLRRYLPPSAAVYNPIDVIGDARSDRYDKSLRAVIDDPNTDGILVILTPQAMTDIEKTAKVIGKRAESTSKPVLCSFMGGRLVEKGRKILNEYKVPNYPYPERAVSAFESMIHYKNWLARRDEIIPSFKDVNKTKVHKMFSNAISSGLRNLTEFIARDVIQVYGFRTPKNLLARTAEEAYKCARAIGLPVVMKIASPDILHKSDIGGVAVGLDSKDQIFDAFYKMTTNVKRIMPDTHLLGVFVQEFIQGGKEVILGQSRDSQFGNLIMFGMGGIYTEVIKDVAFRVAPLTKNDVWDMMREVHSFPLLKGVRGEEPVNLDLLVELILRLSQLVTDFPQIMELDINPLKIFPKDKGGACAIDARIVIEEG